LEAQVAAARGQSGEDHVDDVAVAVAELADVNEAANSGGVKRRIVAGRGAVGGGGGGGDRIVPSRGPGAFSPMAEGCAPLCARTVGRPGP
jgi:hypothetical protein